MNPHRIFKKSPKIPQRILKESSKENPVKEAIRRKLNLAPGHRSIVPPSHRCQSIKWIRFRSISVPLLASHDYITTLPQWRHWRVETGHVHPKCIRIQQPESNDGYGQRITIGAPPTFLHDRRWTRRLQPRPRLIDIGPRSWAVFHARPSDFK